MEREWFCADCPRFFTVSSFFIAHAVDPTVRCPTCKSTKSCAPASEVKP